MLCAKAKRPMTGSDLDKAQEDHHKLFATVHPSLMRPKHHHRLHLSKHYSKHNVSINCWGIEQSHQNYKTIYADNLQHFLQSKDGGKAYSQQLMPRLLLRSVQLRRETSVRGRRLHICLPIHNGRGASQHGIARNLDQS